MLLLNERVSPLISCHFRKLYDFYGSTFCLKRTESLPLQVFNGCKLSEFCAFLLKSKKCDKFITNYLLEYTCAICIAPKASKFPNLGRFDDERTLSLTYCDTRSLAYFCGSNLVVEFATSPIQGLGGKKGHEPA